MSHVYTWCKFKKISIPQEEIENVSAIEATKKQTYNLNFGYRNGNTDTYTGKYVTGIELVDG